MIRALLVGLLVLGAALTVPQFAPTLAGFGDEGSGTASFTANVTQGPRDPGHAYEDVDDSATYENGTDHAIPDHELADGSYTVDGDHGLVLPASVGALEAAHVALVAGEAGHLLVDADLEAEADLTLRAGTRLAVNASLEAGRDAALVAGGALDLDEAKVEAGRALSLDAGNDARGVGAHLEAHAGLTVDAAGAALLTDARLEAGDDVRVTAGGDARLDDARVEATGDVRVDAGGDVLVKRATLEADGALAFEAGGDAPTVYVEGARLLDEDETATVGPEGVEVVGEPAEGSVQRRG